MKLTLKLNLENFQNQDFETNEYSTIEDCYREQIIFLKGWLGFTSYAQPLMDHILSILGDNSVKVIGIVREAREAVLKDRDEAIYESNRSYNGNPEVDKHLDKTTVVESQNFVDVRECKYYSEKSYKLIGYDNREVYIAMSHVIKLESIEGGGTRVIVKPESAWVIEKLEWK